MANNDPFAKPTSLPSGENVQRAGTGSLVTMGKEFLPGGEEVAISEKSPEAILSHQVRQQQAEAIWKAVQPPVNQVLDPTNLTMMSIPLAPLSAKEVDANLDAIGATTAQLKDLYASGFIPSADKNKLQEMANTSAGEQATKQLRGAGRGLFTLAFTLGWSSLSAPSFINAGLLKGMAGEALVAGQASLASSILAQPIDPVEQVQFLRDAAGMPYELTGSNFMERTLKEALFNIGFAGAGRLLVAGLTSSVLQARKVTSQGEAIIAQLEPHQRQALQESSKVYAQVADTLPSAAKTMFEELQRPARNFNQQAAFLKRNVSNVVKVDTLEDSLVVTFKLGDKLERIPFHGTPEQLGKFQDALHGSVAGNLPFVPDRGSFNNNASWLRMNDNILDSSPVEGGLTVTFKLNGKPTNMLIPGTPQEIKTYQEIIGAKPAFAALGDKVNLFKDNNAPHATASSTMAANFASSRPKDWETMKIAARELGVNTDELVAKLSSMDPSMQASKEAVIALFDSVEGVANVLKNTQPGARLEALSAKLIEMDALAQAGRSEFGRSLRAMALVSSNVKKVPEAIAKLKKALPAEQVARIEELLTTPKAVSTLLQVLDFEEPTLAHVLINNLVSSPAIMTGKLESDAMLYGVNNISALAGMGLGKVRSAAKLSTLVFTEDAAKRAAIQAEADEVAGVGFKAAYHAAAMWPDVVAKNAIRDFSQAWRTGHTFFETAEGKAIPVRLGAMTGKQVAFTAATQTVKPLEGITAMANGIEYRTWSNLLASDQAIKEGLSGASVRIRARELTQSVSWNASKAAEAAKFISQLNTMSLPVPPNGLLSHYISGLKSSNMKFLMAPVYLWGWNAVKNFTSGSALGVLANFKSIGQGEIGRAVRGELGATVQNLMYGRMIVGTTMIGGFSYLAAENSIHGHISRDPAVRAAQEGAGWQPLSARVGDSWVSTNHFGPLGKYMTLGADIESLYSGKVITPDEKNSLVTLLGLSLTQMFTEGNLTGRPMEALHVLTHPEDQAATQRFLGSTAAMFLSPGLTNELGKAADPWRRVQATQRESDLELAQGILNVVSARTPIVREGLPEAVDVWGNFVGHSGYSSDVKAEDFKKGELVRLAAKGLVHITPIPKNLPNINITPEDRRDLALEVGNRFSSMVERMVTSPGYEQANEGAKAMRFKLAYSLARETGFLKVLGEKGLAEEQIRNSLKELRQSEGTGE